MHAHLQAQTLADNTLRTPAPFIHAHQKYDISSYFWPAPEMSGANVCLTLGDLTSSAPASEP
jgi:hypothetical protein